MVYSRLASHKKTEAEPAVTAQLLYDVLFNLSIRGSAWLTRNVDIAACSQPRIIENWSVLGGEAEGKTRQRRADSAAVAAASNVRSVQTRATQSGMQDPWGQGPVSELKCADHNRRNRYRRARTF